MKIRINTIGFAQSDKYLFGLSCLKSGMLLVAGGILLTAVGAYGMTHSSTWIISTTDEQREDIVKIFKDYDKLCK